MCESLFLTLACLYINVFVNVRLLFSLFSSVNALIYSVVHDRAMITTPLSPELGSSESEMENYEALLHVAERLSEEKPRGLNKVEIDLIPSFK